MTDTEETRALATVEVISELAPIEGADAIERARVRGWDVVVKKGEFRVGDRIVFFEIDTMLDVNHPAFEFLAARGVRTNSDGRKGHVLKTIRLRGQYSQGLVVPISEFRTFENAFDYEAGTNVTGLLPVWKWEPPIPAQLGGKVEGAFPTHLVRKTDAERVQNLSALFPLPRPSENVGAEVYATEKIDGTSATYILHNGEFRVCSRNWELTFVSDTDENLYWRIAREYEIEQQLRDSAFNEDGSGETLVVQGEIFGLGVQKNPLGLSDVRFNAFSLFRNGVQDWTVAVSLPTVPVLWDVLPPTTVEEALAQVEGRRSVINPDKQAEGIVWRRFNGQPFRVGQKAHLAIKAINNRYLLKHDD